MRSALADRVRRSADRKRSAPRRIRSPSEASPSAEAQAAHSTRDRAARQGLRDASCAWRPPLHRMAENAASVVQYPQPSSLVNMPQLANPALTAPCAQKQVAGPLWYTIYLGLCAKLSRPSTCPGWTP